MIHVAVAQAKSGDVQVRPCHDAMHGLWGEVLSVAAMSRGIGGLILDGSSRNLAAIRALDFPVFVRDTCLRGTGKDKVGAVKIAIARGGAPVRPGAIVVGEEIGLVVIKPETVEQIAPCGEE